jgi:hypothetical protein
MAWTAPVTRATDYLVTAAVWNAEHVDNLNLVPHVIFKTADESVVASTALQDDDHLQFSIGASEAWIFRFVLVHTSGAGAALKVALNAPSGATGWWGYHLATYTTQSVGSRESATFVDGEVDIGGGDDVAYLDGYVLNSTTAGTFKLRWAQNSASGTNTLKKGSFMHIQRVA